MSFEWVDFFKLRHDRWMVYHDHKERMAHAVLLVMLGLSVTLVGSLGSIHDWATTHVGEESRTFVLAAYSLLWLALHSYFRWQLSKRREAALSATAMVSVLAACASDIPTEDDLKPYSREEDVERLGGESGLSGFVSRGIGLLWPIHSDVRFSFDARWSVMPRMAVLAAVERFSSGSGSIVAERYLVAISYALAAGSLSAIVLQWR